MALLPHRTPHDGNIRQAGQFFAASRFNDDQELDETTPIPDTPYGLVYCVGATSV